MIFLIQLQLLLQYQMISIKVGFKLWISFVVLINCTFCYFPKILWTYWDTDMEHSDVLVRNFHASHQKWMKNGWELKLLNSQTVKPYLDKIPDYPGDFDKLEYVVPAHKSVYARFLLLGYYGGVYIDISSFFIQDLSWLEIDNLRNNPDVRNKYIDDPEVLFFTFGDYGSHQHHYQPSLNYTFDISPGYETWFIAAKPGAKFIKEYIPFIRQAFLKNAFVPEGQQKFIRKILDNQHIQQSLLYNNAYLTASQIIQIIIQRKQHQLDKTSKQNNSSRQLAVWYYKFWHIDSWTGPYAAHDYDYWTPVNEYYTRYSLEYIRQEAKLESIRYFIKYSGGSRRQLLKYLNNQRPKDSPLQKLQFQKCPNKYAIYKDSPIYKYLIQGNHYEDYYSLQQRPLFLTDDEACTNSLYNQIQRMQDIIFKLYLVGIFCVIGIVISIFLLTRTFPKKSSYQVFNDEVQRKTEPKQTQQQQK